MGSFCYEEEYTTFWEARGRGVRWGDAQRQLVVLEGQLRVLFPANLRRWVTLPSCLLYLLFEKK